MVSEQKQSALSCILREYHRTPKAVLGHQTYYQKKCTQKVLKLHWVNNVCRKLLSYCLQRLLNSEDHPLLDQILFERPVDYFAFELSFDA
jgi:hypothetical protein